MIKLKKVISQLNDTTYSSIRDALVKNNAENFLFLFESYRHGDISDDDIKTKLNLNPNSFYVLKSRLYDKVQNNLAGDIQVNQADILRQLQQIPDICFNTPREIAVAFLQKLEKDLRLFDMHNELLMVYAAYKKIHLYSDKYFHFSQLYNKHIAFSLSIEKSEEILGNFNRILAQYDFSRSTALLNELLFLRKEILDHFALNNSRQIEIIKNMIELQLRLLFTNAMPKEYDAKEALERTQFLLDELPDSSPLKKWQISLDYLFFEYFRKIEHSKNAALYYDKIVANLECLLLQSHICITSGFLVSKIKYLQELERTNDMVEHCLQVLLIDSDDMHSKVHLALYQAMTSYYAGKYKEAINKLNDVINLYSFKDFFHISADVKLTLAFFYIKVKEYEMADNILKSIYRKIKSDKLDQYVNALDLIKVFTADLSESDDKRSQAKQRDLFTLFMARNNGEYELLKHLQLELNKRYLK
ncbi:MAG: hypothetical protein JST26_01130 [Bacteroidetes bacterium]|nr:hypothetical protein [Bacteroidota bacterium]